MKVQRKQLYRLFYVDRDTSWTCCSEETPMFVQTSREDGDALLRWLGIDPYDGCWLPLSEVRARCTRRLWDVPRNYDAAETVTVPDGRGGLRIECYREEHTLRKLTQQLLKMIKNRTKEGVEQQFFF